MTDHMKQLAAWAKLKTPVKRCLTCRDPHTVELIKEFIRMRNNGETTKSLMGFHSWLCEEHGYELGYTALRNHTGCCEGWSSG